MRDEDHNIRENRENNGDHGGNRSDSARVFWPVRLMKRLFGDQRGATFVYFAVSLPVIIGFGGLGIDVAMWQLEQRKTSDMADAAAVGAGGGVLRTGNFTAMSDNALIAARENGYVAGTGGTITVSNPPVTGPLSAAVFGDPDGDGIAGETNAIEVQVLRPVASYFSSMLSSDQRFVSARAVVVAINRPGGNCFIALDPTSGITLTGNPDVDLACGAVANGTIDVQGSACLTAPEVGYGTTDGSSTSCGDNTTATPSFRISDPLKDLEAMDDEVCDANTPINVNNGGIVNLAPDDTGVYVICSAVTINPGGTLNLAAGVYVFEAGATLDVKGTMNGPDGVMLYFTDDTRSSVGNPPLNIDAAASVNLVAMQPGDLDNADSCGGSPCSGFTTVDGASVAATTLDETFSDIVIYQDRDTEAANGGEVEFYNFTGGSDMTFEGIIYLPGAIVKWSGGAASVANAVVSDGIEMTGNSVFGTIEGTNLATRLAIVFIRLVE